MVMLEKQDMYHGKRAEIGLSGPNIKKLLNGKIFVTWKCHSFYF